MTPELDEWEHRITLRARIYNLLPRIVREWDARWTFYCNWRCFLTNERWCKGNGNNWKELGHD